MARHETPGEAPILPVDAEVQIGASRKSGEIMADRKPKPEISDPQLAGALARLGAAIRPNPNKYHPERPPPAKVIQLPLWPEAAPTVSRSKSVTRSAPRRLSRLR